MTSTNYEEKTIPLVEKIETVMFVQKLNTFVSLDCTGGFHVWLKK